MNRIFCDLCGNPCEPNKLNGGMMRNKEMFPLMPGMAPGEHLVQKRIFQEVWDLCEDCQKFIWRTAEKKQEELKKASSIIKP